MGLLHVLHALAQAGLGELIYVRENADAHVRRHYQFEQRLRDVILEYAEPTVQL